MSWLHHTNSLGPRVDRRLHRWTLRSLRTARRQQATTGSQTILPLPATQSDAVAAADTGPRPAATNSFLNHR
jgi:hypothetical protein